MFATRGKRLTIRGLLEQIQPPVLRIRPEYLDHGFVKDCRERGLMIQTDDHLLPATGVLQLGGELYVINFKTEDAYVAPAASRRCSSQVSARSFA